MCVTFYIKTSFSCTYVSVCSPCPAGTKCRVGGRARYAKTASYVCPCFPSRLAPWPKWEKKKGACTCKYCIECNRRHYSFLVCTVLFGRVCRCFLWRWSGNVLWPVTIQRLARWLGGQGANCSFSSFPFEGVAAPWLLFGTAACRLHPRRHPPLCSCL